MNTNIFAATDAYYRDKKLLKKYFEEQIKFYSEDDSMSDRYFRTKAEHALELLNNGFSKEVVEKVYLRDLLTVENCDGL